MDEAKTGKKSRKKRLIIIGIIIVFVILLIPYPFRYKDGGSVEYKAILYSYMRYNAYMTPTYRDGMAYETMMRGSTFSILGITVYDGTFTDVSEDGRPINQWEIDSGRVTPTPTLTPVATATPTSTPISTPTPSPSPEPTSTPVPTIPAPQEDSYAYRGQYDYSGLKICYSDVAGTVAYNRTIRYYDSDSQLLRERFLLDDQELFYIDHSPLGFTERMQGSDDYHTYIYVYNYIDSYGKPDPSIRYETDADGNVTNIAGDSSKLCTYHKDSSGRLSGWTLTRYGISLSYGVKYYSDGTVLFYPEEKNGPAVEPEESFDHWSAVVFLPGEKLRSQLLSASGLDFFRATNIYGQNGDYPPYIKFDAEYYFDRPSGKPAGFVDSVDGGLVFYPGNPPEDRLLYFGSLSKKALNTYWADCVTDSDSRIEIHYEGDRMTKSLISGGGYGCEEYKYDKSGRLIEYSDANDSPDTHKDKYTYNSSGQLVSCTRDYEIQTEYPVSDGTEVGKLCGKTTYQYSYDANGTLTSVKGEGSEHIEKYNYNEETDDYDRVEINPLTYTCRLAPYTGNGTD